MKIFFTAFLQVNFFLYICIQIRQDYQFKLFPFLFLLGGKLEGEFLFYDRNLQNNIS